LPRPTGLVGWWRGEGDGCDFIAGTNAVPRGSVTFTQAKVGQGFVFPGGAFEAAPVVRSGAMTIDLWVKSASQNEPYFTSAISSGFPGHFNQFFQIMFDTGGHWALNVGEGSYEVMPLFGFANTTFQHLAVTYDGMQQITLYLDGKQATTAAWKGPKPVAYEVLKIGTNRGENVHFAGIIDEVHIFDRALSEDEVNAIFRSGAAGLCP
jgi:concanavalin A-like lectin/glucanase superfamily protein